MENCRTCEQQPAAAAGACTCKISVIVSENEIVSDSKARAVPEDRTVGTKVLNGLGAACTYLAGSAFAGKSSIVTAILLLTGYFASHALLVWLNKVTGGLRPGNRPFIAGLYVFAALGAMVIAHNTTG